MNSVHVHTDLPEWMEQRFIGSDVAFQKGTESKICSKGFSFFPL